MNLSSPCQWLPHATVHMQALQWNTGRQYIHTSASVALEAWNATPFGIVPRRAFLTVFESLLTRTSFRLPELEFLLLEDLTNNNFRCSRALRIKDVAPDIGEGNPGIGGSLRENYCDIKSLLFNYILPIQWIQCAKLFPWIQFQMEHNCPVALALCSPMLYKMLFHDNI